MPITSKYVFVASMDVDPANEALFNEVYDTEHIPELLNCYHAHLPARDFDRVRLALHVRRMQECSDERLQDTSRWPYIFLETAWILEGFSMC